MPYILFYSESLQIFLRIIIAEGVPVEGRDIRSTIEKVPRDVRSA